MKLVPFSPQHLRLNDPLPFGLREASGRLLLAAGQQISKAERLEELARQPLFAEESESSAWYKRLTAAMDQALRRGATLSEVASTRPEALVRPSNPMAVAPLSLADAWYELVGNLDQALREVAEGSEGLGRTDAVLAKVRTLAERRPDASLMHLIFEATQSVERYSCRHALLACLVVELTVPVLGWSSEEREALGRAALLMNVGMLGLQDQLAGSALPPTPAMREAIEQHPSRGAALLRAAGCTDELLIATVADHHRPATAHPPLDSADAASRCIALLSLVDVTTALFSQRVSRPAMAPAQALRDACRGPDGKPVALAPALVRALGLYPPGSFVELVGGEVAMVLRRGKVATQPEVGLLTRPDGMPLGEPSARDTSDKRFAVKGPLDHRNLRVRPPIAKLIALR